MAFLDLLFVEGDRGNGAAVCISWCHFSVLIKEAALTRS
jgi:hypothetical protein